MTKPFIPPKMPLYAARIKRSMNLDKIGSKRKDGTVTDVFIVPAMDSAPFTLEYIKRNKKKETSITNEELLDEPQFITDNYTVVLVVTKDDGGWYYETVTT